MLCPMTEMLLIHEAFYFRLYPTKEQAAKLKQMLGSKRFVYNYFLSRCRTVYAETGKGMSYKDCANELPALKSQFGWLKEVHSQVLQQGLKDLDIAFQRFFKKEAGYPRFKKKRHSASIRYPQGFKVDLTAEQTFIPKIGWVKTVFHQPIRGEMRNITVSLSPSGQFHVSIQCRYEMKAPVYAGGSIGIDLGLDHFLTTSDGVKVENPRHLQKALKRLKHRQRQLSRKQMGSKARERARRQLAKAHQKVANQRKDFLNKLSYRLVNDNQVISLKNLDIRGMMQEHELAQSIGAMGWNEFIRQLKYKGQRYGCDLLIAPAFYPSSSICSNCGHLHANLQLSELEWQCPDCKTSHDTSINAAINLKNYPTAGSVGS